jgi:mycofactocin system glycosyltransferase
VIPTGPAAGTAPGTVVPLPAGFGVAFDPGTRTAAPDVLFGGSPPRLMRLTAAGLRAVAELRRGPVGSPGAGLLGRLLTDAGLAHPRPPAARGPADATVVIPVRDRAGGLDRALAALGRGYPVIVVDDGSADPAAVARACARHGARLVRRPAAGGPGAARNDGLALVTTSLVAFLDSDCVAGPDWITGLAPHFADPLVAAVAPRVRPLVRPGAAGRYLAARSPLDLGDREARVAPLTRVAYVPTAALLVRREAIAAPGRGFDPALRYGEDVDLVWRLHEAGWRVRYDPAAQAGHAEPARWRAVLARRFRYGNSAAPLARKHPGQVPALVLPVWPAAAAAAVAARRPLLALAAYGAGTAQLARLLRRWGVPARGIARPMARSVLQTWLGAGRFSVQYGTPVLAVALARPGGRTLRRRNGRRAALAALAAGPPVAEWLRTRPRLGPAAFTLAYLADEAAYGAGVYRGALRERLAAPLLPRISRRPLPRPAPRATPRT